MTIRNGRVAGWVFDHVVRVSRPYILEAGSSRLVDLLNQSETGLNYISLEKLSAQELSAFRDALERGYHDTVTIGAEAFGDPSVYPAFVKRFQELLDMMPRD